MLHLLSEAEGLVDNSGFVFGIILALTVPFSQTSNIESRKRPRLNSAKPMVSDIHLINFPNLAKRALEEGDKPLCCIWQIAVIFFWNQKKEYCTIVVILKLDIKARILCFYDEGLKIYEKWLVLYICIFNTWIGKCIIS